MARACAGYTRHVVPSHGMRSSTHATTFADRSDVRTHLALVERLRRSGSLSGLVLEKAERVPGDATRRRAAEVAVTLLRHAVRVVLVAGAAIAAYLLLGMLDRPAHASAIGFPPDPLPTAVSPLPPLPALPGPAAVDQPGHGKELGHAGKRPVTAAASGTARQAGTGNGHHPSRRTAAHPVPPEPTTATVPARTSASATIDRSTEAASGAMPRPVRAAARLLVSPAGNAVHTTLTPARDAFPVSVTGLLPGAPVLAPDLAVPDLAVPDRVAPDLPLYDLLLRGLLAPEALIPQPIEPLVAQPTAPGWDRSAVPARCATGATRSPATVWSSGATPARPWPPGAPARGPDQATYDAASTYARGSAGDHRTVSAAMAAASIVHDSRPHVAVLDVGTLAESGDLVDAHEINNVFPGCALLVLVDPAAPRAMGDVLGPRVRGIFGKDGGPCLLARYIRLVAEGKRVIDPTLAFAALCAPANPLTAREREILRVATSGVPSSEIAARMHLAVGTVRNHLSTIIRKTGGRNRMEAISAAKAAGWI